MNEQNKATGAKRSRILVMYGYHIQERFAPEVVSELMKMNFPKTTFAKFPGERLDPVADEKDHRTLIRRKFMKRFLPFDYALDVHDSPDAVDLPYYTFPACGFIYKSKLVIPRRLRNALEAYSGEQDKKFPGRYVARTFIDRWRDMSSKYDKLSIEFVPKYISQDQSISYLAGLIKTLSANPRRL